jgi:hypothetical protein
MVPGASRAGSRGVGELTADDRRCPPPPTQSRGPGTQSRWLGGPPAPPLSHLYSSSKLSPLALWLLISCIAFSSIRHVFSAGRRSSSHSARRLGQRLIGSGRACEETARCTCSKQGSPAPSPYRAAPCTLASHSLLAHLPPYCGSVFMGCLNGSILNCAASRKATPTVCRQVSAVPHRIRACSCTEEAAARTPLHKHGSDQCRTKAQATVHQMHQGHSPRVKQKPTRCAVSNWAGFPAVSSRALHPSPSARCAHAVECSCPHRLLGARRHLWLLLANQAGLAFHSQQQHAAKDGSGDPERGKRQGASAPSPHAGTNPTSGPGSRRALKASSG